MLLFWPEKSLVSSYKTIAVATKIISHLSNIEKGEGGGGRLCVLGNRSNNYVTDCSYEKPNITVIVRTETDTIKLENKSKVVIFAYKFIEEIHCLHSVYSVLYLFTY